MEGSGDRLAFDDVAVYFSVAEWGTLEEWQRELYKEVMIDNYRTLCSLDLNMGTPEILLKITRGEEPCVDQVPKRSYWKILECSEADIGTTPAPDGSPMKSDGSAEVDLRVRRKRTPKLPLEIITSFPKRKRKVIHRKASDTAPKQRSEKDRTPERDRTLERDRTPDADTAGSSGEPGPGDKLYICVDCGKTFDLWQSLLTHIRVHNASRLYSCLDCDLSFSCRATYRLHQKLHVGVKPFECSVCGKRFLRKSYLVVHMRSHTKGRPFVCSTCNKSFVEPSKLRRHVRIHTDEKPFRCDICGKCFNDPSVLNRHQKGHVLLSNGKYTNYCPVIQDPTDFDPNTQKEGVFQSPERGQDITSLSWLINLKTSQNKEGSTDRVLCVSPLVGTRHVK